MQKIRILSYSTIWNLILIVAGSVIQAIAFKALSTPHGFVPSGLFGVASLLEYRSGIFGAGFWYLLLNLPMFVLGYLLVSRRFLAYSLVSMLVVSVSYAAIDFQMLIHNQLYAAVCFGVMAGGGAGIVLRSLGSNGGLDVVAIILNQRYNFGIGKTYFFFNFVLFSFSFVSLDNDLVIASLIAAFVASVSVDYCLSLFNQRKLCVIISAKNKEIADRVMEKLKVGATFLHGEGAYSNGPLRVLLVVTNNIQLKRLEEIVFTQDPNALFIADNTFAVIGSTFTRRKKY